MSYKKAIQWIVDNDDTECIVDDDIATVTTNMVADLFDKDVDKVMQDIKKLLTKRRKPND